MSQEFSEEVLPGARVVTAWADQVSIVPRSIYLPKCMAELVSKFRRFRRYGRRLIIVMRWEGQAYANPVEQASIILHEAGSSECVIGHVDHVLFRDLDLHYLSNGA